MPNESVTTAVGEDWADVIRLERHRQRLKQAEVASLAGVAQATVSEAEYGRGSLDAFRAIASALDITLPEPQG